jgi:CubicO group peptidase (beta-lactamase class C family)
MRARLTRSLLLCASFVTTLAFGAAPAPTTGPKPAPVAAPASAASAAATPPPATPTVAGARPLTAEDATAWLDGFVPYALSRGDVAGAVVTIVKDGQMLVSKGYGYSDVKTRKPVDPATTMIRPGSVSKLLTWTAVMQMVEAGKLDLDADVNKYLDFRIPERADGPITLRHVMTHTPGFEEQIKALIIADPALLMPLSKYAREYTPIRIFKAGSTPAYSNYATALAGYLVERASGQSFDDYVDEHIFKPLGMKHATFRQPLPRQFEPFMSNGYALASQDPKPYELVIPAPAGSLAASGEDMARFMIAHLNGGEFEGQRILSQQTADLMHGTPTTIIPSLNRMVLGFYEQNYNGHRVISHGGDTQYMHSYLHLFLDDHVGVFISVNSVGKDGAAGAIRSHLFEQFADRYFPSTAAPLPTAPTAAAHARDVAGTYLGSRRPDRSFLAMLGYLQPINVIANPDDTISISIFRTPGGGGLRKFREVAPYVWEDTANRWRVAAKVENGRVVRVSEDEVSPFWVFEPYPASKSPDWIVPAVAVGIGATLLTTLFWPIGAIVRWRLRAKLALTPEGAKARTLTRVGSLAVAGITITWVCVAVFGLTGFKLLVPSFDKWLYVLYALSVVAYVGGAAALVWGCVRTFRAGRPWYSKAWAVVLAFSGLAVLYFAYVAHLMSFQVKY